jgi:AcrR family transcriptional regulator
VLERCSIESNTVLYWYGVRVKQRFPARAGGVDEEGAMAKEVPAGDGRTVEPPWWGTRDRPAARDRLSREQIIDTALAIIDVEGVEAVTVRRLARELDTGAASLYWHVANKEQILELVYDRILGEITFPEPDPARWEEQIREVARSSYEVFARHADAALLSIGSVPFGPNGLRMIEWMLALLRGAGAPDAIAGFFGDLLGRFIDASVLEETRARDGLDPERMAMMGDYIQALPPERFPNILAMVPTMFAGDAQSRFELGLDFLLDGLRVHMPVDG